MLKRGILTLSFVILSGCATHHQANQLAGATVGGVVGHQLGGTGGAVFGAAVGSVIGSQYTSPQQTCFLNQRLYQARIDGCDIKFRNDPRYDVRHRDACYNQAKQLAMTCR